ncbi:hypothetical protein WJX73_003400 [Symbiochloris irregularis]|uniref:Protein kinase domain-containing protein n=1 Tax=Symbiochloris irregularis TaxID=706552 RepID=A0AAW1PFJ8_9CHLO
MLLLSSFPDVRQSVRTMQDDPFQWRSSDCPFLSLRPEDFTDRCVIGRGRGSTVYSAKCAALGGRPFAIKIYSKDSVSSSKLKAIRREASLMVYTTRKQVPHVTRLYGAFQDESQIWLVMELGQGGDLLQRFLKEGRIMSEARVCQRVAMPLLAALKSLHELNIIHRDVKLENIFLTAKNEVLLGDFGLSMSTKQELAVSPVGTVEYMAPEVVTLPHQDELMSGAVLVDDLVPCTNRVDIWALGVTVYELLAGRLPFTGRTSRRSSTTSRRGASGPCPSPSHHRDRRVVEQASLKPSFSAQGREELNARSTTDGQPLTMAQHAGSLANLSTSQSFGPLSVSQSYASDTSCCSEHLAKPPSRLQISSNTLSTASQKGAALLDASNKGAAGQQEGLHRPLASPLGDERKTIPANWPDQSKDCADPTAAPVMPSPRRRLATSLSKRMKNLLWSKDNAVRMKGR